MKNFNWNLDEEYFYFSNYIFDVRAAKEKIINTADISSVEIDVNYWYNKRKKFNIPIDTDRIVRYPHKYDLNIPLIFVEIPVDNSTHYMLIDGWHRLAKAHRENIQKLNAFFFSKKEALPLLIR